MQKILKFNLKHVALSIFLLISVSFLNASFYTSLYSDHKSFSIGDILTVNISETSKASSSSQSNTERSLSTNMNIQAGQGPLDFIPLSGMGGSSSNNFKGDANTSRDASLSAKMTVSIVDIDSNGNLMIKGSRVVTINGEDEITTLEGVVRSQDVGADNTIYSHNIADAKISYKGKGAVNEGSRVGLISRIFNFIF
ncbi:MAG: flagellar basal body L-ring protein FlgH [Candidatus Cloacimonetes bacterium]|jgi:flagellar L-ring protein precursor FlgH|nr:flagellar basal body L-ring protein FlgH [Candidatus Cloacimonadota bacterium]MDD4155553.1 flagellar basal body L-ring protein FlgH [Candidatus Cloacimonadota bacterium]